jgi:uncharacterized peroxidase-related enzyme
VPVPGEIPGILGLFAFRPQAGQPMRALAEALLRGPSPLTPAERELIAALVSTGNQCRFCASSHGAAAKHLLGGDEATVDAVCTDYRTAPVSPKLKALLAIAEKVRGDARSVTSRDIQAAREAGATDLDVHDAVLVAAAFCMYNRYVDGLAAFTPTDPAVYDQAGARLAKEGYLGPMPPVRP